MVAYDSDRVAIHRGRHIPPPVTGRPTVERRRLYDKLDVLLDDDGGTRIASITAPAGSGKTVLLSRWCRIVAAQGRMSVAWLTVDDSDNAVEVLFAAVVAALAAATGRSELTSEEPAFLDTARADHHSAGARISNVLHETGRLCLVIDDAHLLHDVTALEELASLFRWTPVSCRLVLAGRFEPPLLLTRARVAGDVIEIAPEQMNLTASEAHELLMHHGFDVNGDVLDALMAKTEGWAAGLQLAALTALRSDNPTTMLTHVGGTDRAVSDYLIDEFIASLSETTKRILVATAIPDSVSASLAVHLTGEPHAHVVLEALAHNNFLLTRSTVDGEVVYSFHPMMRAYLRAESEYRDDPTTNAVRRRLALWYLQHQRPYAALANAIDSGDVATIEAVIESSCVELILGVHRFRETLDLLHRAPPTIQSHITTRLVVAALQLAEGHRAPAAATLAAVDRTHTTASAVDRALAAILRAQLALRSDATDADTMTTALRHLDRIADSHDSVERAEISASVALQETVIELSRGRLDHARHHLVEARDHAWAAGSPTLELHCAGAQSILSAFEGQFGSVIGAANRAEVLSNSHALADTEALYLTQTLAAHARALRHDPEPSTASDTPQWARLADSAAPSLAETARIILGLTRATGAANEIANRLRPQCTPDRDPLASHMRALLSPEIQYNFLRSGNVADAVAYAAHVRQKLGDCAESAVVAAMVQRSGGRHAKARATLAPVLRGGNRPVHSLTLLWAWLEEAALTADEPAVSFSALCAALEHAAPETLIHPFVYCHDRVRMILDRNRGRFGTLNSFAEVVRNAVKPDDLFSVVRLSPREMDLLRELPTFRTTDAIAADQFVSVNTVKTHLRGIYRKLGVGNRRDAIAAAQQIGLI